MRNSFVGLLKILAGLAFATTVSAKPLPLCHSFEHCEEVGHALVDQNEIPKAIGFYKKAIEFMPARADDVFLHIGLAWLALPDPDKAIQAFNQVTSLHPDKVLSSHLMRATALALKGEVQKAIPDIQKAVSVSDKLKKIATHMELAQPVFDDREWKIGWSQEPHSMYGPKFNEYVLSDETVHNWSELVTIQFLPDNKDTLSEFEKKFKSQLNQLGFVFSSRVYQSKNDRVWSFQTHPEATSHESLLIRFVKTQRGLHVFQYANKKVPLSDQLKEEWIKRLRCIQIFYFSKILKH